MVLGRKHKPPDKPPAAPVVSAPPVVSPPPIVGAAESANSPYRELGNTTRDAFKQAMLRTVGGAVPFAAELDAMYDALAAKGVTRLAVPMSWMECKNSTYPTCGVPQHSRNPWSVTGSGDAGSNGRWASYSGYAKAAEAWADLVTEGSPYKSATSIKDFIHIYAPGSDNNNEARYVQVIVDGVNALPLAGGTTPAPSPRDIVDVIVGGKPTDDSYGFKSPQAAGTAGFYDYFVGHGGTAWQHTGIDASGTVGQALYTPIDGTIVCGGTGVGSGAYGSSCAAFPFQLPGYATTGSSGRLEIMHDDGVRTLILGHVQRCLVSVGDRVTAGQQVATMGGQNGPHVHIEARIWKNGNYTIVDPRATFGSAAVPIPVERVPYNFDPEAEPAPNLFTVTAAKALTVYQRADPNAAVLDTISAGETFQAVAIIPGNDGKPWYLGIHDGRVPLDGTESDAWST